MLISDNRGGGGFSGRRQGGSDSDNQWRRRGENNAGDSSSSTIEVPSCKIGKVIGRTILFVVGISNFLSKEQWTYGPTYCLSIDTHIHSKTYKVVYFWVFLHKKTTQKQTEFCKREPPLAFQLGDKKKEENLLIMCIVNSR